MVWWNGYLIATNRGSNERFFVYNLFDNSEVTIPNYSIISSAALGKKDNTVYVLERGGTTPAINDWTINFTDSDAATVVPDAPTGLGGTQTYEEVTLTWDDPTDDTITGYKIYRDSVVLVEDTGSTTREYVDDTVAGNTEYVYKIAAINDVGTSDDSSTYTITTDPLFTVNGGTVDFDTEIDEGDTYTNGTIVYNVSGIIDGDIVVKDSSGTAIASINNTEPDAGSYTIEYSIMNVPNNPTVTIIESLTVTAVADTTAPTFTIDGNSASFASSLEFGNIYTEHTFEDIVDEDASPEEDIVYKNSAGTVITSFDGDELAIGTYSVEYTLTDESDNTTTIIESITVEDTTAPTIESGVPASADVTTVEVSWRVTFSEDVQNVDRTDFGIKRVGVANFDPHTVTQISASVYDVFGTLPEPDVYHLRLRTTSDITDLSGNLRSGTGEISDSTITYTAAATVPEDPTGLAGSEVSGEVALTWDDPTDDTITGYKIFRKTGTAAYTTLVEDTASTTQSYTDDTVSEGTTYTYKIQAVNDTGNSGDSNEFEIRTINHHTVSLSDSLSITDVVTRTSNITRSMTDSLAITDTITKLRSVPRALIDSLSITDTISKIRAVTVRLTEGSATTTTTEDTLGIRALVGSAVSSTVLLGMAYHDAANTLYQTSRASSISTLHSRSYDGTTLATALTEQEETAVGVAYTALAVSANKLLVAQRIPTAAVHDYDISLTDGALTNKRTLTVAAAADALPIKMQGMSVHISSGKLAIADVETNTIIDYDYDAVAGTLSGKRPLTVSDSVFTPTNPRSISFHGDKLVVVDRTIDKIYSYNYDTDAGTIGGETELADETDIQSSVFVGDDLLFGDATFVINKRLFTPGVTTTTGAALRISDALTTSSGAIVSLTDSISITDTITRLKAATRSLTDSISLSDSVTRSKLSNTIRTLADSLSISDAITRIRATTVHLIEDSATSTTSQAITVNADKSPDLDIADASVGDVSEAVYDSPSFDVSDEDTFPSDVIFSPDGLKMFVLGASSDSIYQYTLSTAWDINTAVYDTVLLNVSSQEGAPYGFTFSPDGTKMFIVGALSDSVHSYSLATAWDISDVTYISAFNVSSEDGSPHGVTFSPDGLKMFIVGAGSDSVYQYTLSTAWDISTAVHHSISFSVNSEDTFPSGVTFSSDGLKMFIMGNSTDSVYQYSLTTAWDISDVTYNSVSLDITSQDTFPHGVTFSSDGTKMFVIGSSSDSVHAYNIPLSAGITSDDIIISDDYRTSTDGVSITIDTTHTDRTSLSFRVRNPAGDWTDSINLADSASQSFDLTFPNEGDTDGTWRIEITDDTPGIVGTLDSWDLDITTTSVTETTTSGSLFISDSITRTKSSGAMVSLSDSLSISDGITRLKAATRTLSDSLSISDSITRLKAATRSLTDSLSATDTITKLRHVHSSLTDSLSITDSIAKLKSKTNTLTDSLSITDSVTRLKAAKRSFTESLTITDTIYASTAGAIRLVDSLSITDSMTMIKAATRSLSDSLSISDTVSEIRTELRSLTDSLSISDTISKIRAVTVSLTEGATTTTVTPATPDSLGDAVSLGSSLESVVSRGMAYHNTPGMMYYVSHESGTSTIASRLYNTITTLIGAALSTQDTLSSMTITALAVSGNKLLAAQRSPTNQMYDYDISTTDGAISNIRTITPSDIPGTVHGMSVHQTSGKVAISDVATAGIYDYDYNSATGVMDAQRLLVISDGVFTPTAARSISFHGDKLIISDFGTDKMYSYNYDSVAGTLSGETELADETNVQASTFAGDDLLLIRDDRIIYRRPFTAGTPSSTSTVVSGAALSISDALTKSSGAIVLLSDSLSITDSLTRLKAATRTLADSVTISDVLHGGTAGVVRLSDSLSITDAVTRMKTTTRSLSDSLSITDTVRNIRVEIRRLADSLSITDSAVIIQTKLVQLTDSLSITDAATRMQTRVIRLADSLSITDSIIKSQTLVRSLSDSLSITDRLHVPQDYIRHLTDSLSITDSAAAFKRNITRSRIYRAISDSLTIHRAKLE